jgi:hypothetical protein
MPCFTTSMTNFGLTWKWKPMPIAKSGCQMRMQAGLRERVSGTWAASKIALTKFEEEVSWKRSCRIYDTAFACS